MSESDGETLVVEVKQKLVELERLLDDFGDRLRRMRRRNRQVEEELGAFESDLDRLRRWLTDQTSE